MNWYFVRSITACSFKSNFAFIPIFSKNDSCTYDILSVCRYHLTIVMSDRMLSLDIILNVENRYVDWFQPQGNSMNMKNCKIMIIDGR